MPGHCGEKNGEGPALSKVYQLIEADPVVLLTTGYDGALNVMTLSWHMVMDFDPPLIARRN